MLRVGGSGKEIQGIVTRETWTFVKILEGKTVYHR